MSARIYDTRNFSAPIIVLLAPVACFRSLRWTPEGRFLIAAEEIDNVHIFDRAKGFTKAQVISLVGNIAGISLSPDGDDLYAAVCDPIFGCIAQFDRKTYSLSNLVV